MTTGEKPVVAMLSTVRRGPGSASTVGRGAGSEPGIQERTSRPAPQTGGCSWLPTPGAGSIGWNVVTLHQPGFGAEAGLTVSDSRHRRRDPAFHE
jgi:hypothetical protein